MNEIVQIKPAGEAKWDCAAFGEVMLRFDPGFGRVRTVVLSLVLLQIISTGFNLLGFSPHLTEAIWGATMILALVISFVRTRRENRPAPAN